MVAVDQREARADTSQRPSRRFIPLREVRSMSGEFDRGTQQGGGNRIGGENQNGLTVHVDIPARVSTAGAGAG